MRKLSPLKYHPVHFMLANLFLLALMSTTLGSFDTVSEAKCEYEDANLIWRNTPAYSLNDVKAMEWYKEKGGFIATWSEGKGFVEYAPYIGRLMQIGETGIKIKKANGSDSGTYWLSLTLASVYDKLKAATHLEVKVAPSSQCKPIITPEGSILKAELPSEGCGTPHLTPKWKHTNKAVIQGNSSSLLDLGSNPEPGEYMVCAEGESAQCYQKNISDLCTTISRHGRSDDELTSVILPCVLVSVLVLVLVALVILRTRRLIRKYCCENTTDSRQRKGSYEMEESKPKGIVSTFVLMTMDTTLDTQSLQDNEETCALIEKGETASTEFSEIQNHLRRLYKNITRVSVSPAGKGTYVDVSEVYINLDFQQLETRDIKDTETVSATSPDTLHPTEGNHSVKAQTEQFCPTVILGDNGSGKSTWCKHLVQCWSQNSNSVDANVQGLNLADLGKFKILLYLPLKSSHRDLSFQELLEQYLFQQHPAYLDIIMKYMYDENRANSILIVIDGLDKFGDNVKPILKFFDHKLLSACTVILTSRPNSLKLIFDACAASSIRLQISKVTEMTLEKAKQYVHNVLIIKNCQEAEDFNIDNFLLFTEYLHVQCLLKLPYLCLILLFVWMENENVFIEVLDILLGVVENILHRAITDQRCKENIKKVLQEKSCNVPTSVNKLSKRPFLMKHVYVLYAHSVIADENFIYEINRFAGEERSLHETSTRGTDMFPLEVMYEIGLVTKSPSLNSDENQSKVTFTNELIYEFFVSMAIAFKKGHAFDHIVSDKEVALKNSRIIHILWQLSPVFGKKIFVTIGGKESKSRDGNKDMNKWNKIPRYSIAHERFWTTNSVTWLQSLMYKGELDNEKLLFLTNALKSTASLTSLVLKNHENKTNLVFWLPLSETLKKLRLDINNCTLLLCQEWNYQTPSKLEEMVIKSVNINTSTLGLLTRSFDLCKDLHMLEMTPEVVRTDDAKHLTEKLQFGKYWIQLAKSIKKIRKLKTLKLCNLSLIGRVDNLLFSIKSCKNLETLELKDLSSTLDENIPEPLGVTDDDDRKKLDKIHLAHLELENLKLQHSPLDFLFEVKDEIDKARVIRNDLKVLRLSTVDMPADDWRILGNQISALNPSELQLQNIDPRGSMQTFVNGICKCKDLRTLSLDNMDIIKFALQTLNKLSQLKLERMKIEGSYLLTLFRQINECKELNTLCLCNTAIEHLPQELYILHNLQNLSIDNVTINGGSLYDFLIGFGRCENLKTISLRNIHEEGIHLKLSAHNEIKWKIDIE